MNTVTRFDVTVEADAGGVPVTWAGVLRGVNYTYPDAKVTVLPSDLVEPEPKGETPLRTLTAMGSNGVLIRVTAPVDLLGDGTVEQQMESMLEQYLYRQTWLRSFGRDRVRDA